MGLLEELLRSGLQGGLGQAMGRRQPPAGQAGSGMSGVVMALLPVVLSMLAKNRSGAATPGVGKGSASTPGGGMGGLGEILEQFQRKGFGDQARSWVSTGPNLPISPDVIAQVFGQDGLAKIASQAGLSPHQASAGLSDVLPDVVDKLTPQGQVPDLGALAASVDDLQRRLGV